ncbi:equilibrative nucleoside transporter 4, partial [Asbolus verrucosus]
FLWIHQYATSKIYPSSNGRRECFWSFHIISTSSYKISDTRNKRKYNLLFYSICFSSSNVFCNIETSDAQYGVLKIQNSPPPTGNTLSFANPAYEPSAPMPVPTYKVEDVVIRGRQSLSTAGGLSGIRRGLLARWEITKAIHPYMISICLVYFATLCLYPGIASEIISCRLGSWMPILMMALFNGADLFGKMLASSSRYWTGGRLVRCSVARLIMIPLMIMCVAPRASPIFSAEVTAFTFALILGFSNGILGSVPMIQAPSKVDDRYRELTGNIMTLLYNFGLTTGSLMAYFLESVLSPVENHPCSPNQAHVKIPDTPANFNLTTVIHSTSVTIVTLASTLSTGAENSTDSMR